MKLSDVWGDIQRAVYMSQRLFVIILMMPGKSQEMQGIGVLGMCGQHLPVYFFGSGRIAGLMLLDRLSEQPLDSRLIQFHLRLSRFLLRGPPFLTVHRGRSTLCST